MPNASLLVFREIPENVPLRKWLGELKQSEPKAYAKCLERIRYLEQFGFNARRPRADILRDGIWELRAKLGRVNYRILYFFCGQNVACLSNGCTKEGAVPDSEIEFAIRAKKLVDRDRNRYTQEWEF